MSKKHSSLDFLPQESNFNTVIYIYNIRITIRMLHTITKRLEICIDINIEIS